jgi:succinylglutamic semialdehyde dehydrogenase
VAAGEAQCDWAAKPREERVNAMRKVRAAVVNRREDLAATITREVGKPLWEARREVESMAGRLNVVLDAGLREVADFVPAGVRGGCTYRPLGVVAIVTPFNFPALLAHGFVIPALVTGNTVVLKPSEVTPLVGQIYAEIFDDAHLPKGVFNMVQGAGDVGTHLVGHVGVDGVFFTGSVATGRAIEAACAKQPGKMLVLEMGGKNAALVLDDADIDLAVHECLVSGYITSGQRCTASSRVVVTRKVADEFVRRFAERVKAIHVGDPLAPDTFMGPLATETGMERFVGRVAEGRTEGALPLVEGGRFETATRGHFVAPSVHEIILRRPGSVYQEDELFGPDVAIYRAKNIDAAVDIANDSPFGLAACVFSTNEKTYRAVAGELRVGLVNWNRPTVGADARLPFGGVGVSGNHRAVGLHAIRWCVTPVASVEAPVGKVEEWPGLGPAPKIPYEPD